MEEGEEIHRFKSNGIKLTKPTKVIQVTLPEGLTKEQIQEIINEFMEKTEEEKEEILEQKDHELENIDEIEEPSCDPECTEATEDDEIECEFENRDGSWWCTTHNCWA